MKWTPGFTNDTVFEYCLNSWTKNTICNWFFATNFCLFLGAFVTFYMFVEVDAHLQNTTEKMSAHSWWMVIVCLWVMFSVLCTYTVNCTMYRTWYIQCTVYLIIVKNVEYPWFIVYNILCSLCTLYCVHSVQCISDMMIACLSYHKSHHLILYWPGIPDTPLWRGKIFLVAVNWGQLLSAVVSWC